MHDLVLSLSPERLATVYGELPAPAQAALDSIAAQVLKSRALSVRRLPLTTRARAVRAHLARRRDDVLAADLLRSYLLGPRRALVVAFLEATGVVHQDGQVEGEAAPEPGKVGEAVRSLAAAHDPQDVALYLEVAVRQWPEIAELKTALDSLR